jgi:hypothetical protein
MRSRTVAAALGAVGLAGVLLLGGYALGEEDVSGGGAGGDRDGRAAAQVSADLARLHELTWGSQPARQAVEVLAYVEFHERMGVCLRGLGFGHTPEPFRDATTPDPPPLDWLTALPPTDERIAAARGFGPPEVSAQTTPRRGIWPGPQAWVTEREICERQATRAGGPRAAPDGKPAGSLPALDPSRYEELFRLAHDRRVKKIDAAGEDGYADCMHAAGAPLDNGRGGTARMLFARRAEGGPATAEEKRVAVADARCRAPMHRKAMAALDAPLREFRARHAARLAGLAARPDELQAHARRAAGRIGLPVGWL